MTQRLIDPHHGEWLKQACSGERPSIKDLESEVFNQSFYDLLGLWVVAGHELYRASGVARGVAEDIRADLV
jgi:hypothetical protein